MKLYGNGSIDLGTRGTVRVTVRRNAVNITLRKGRYGFTEASVPYGTDYNYLLRILPSMIDRLKEKEMPAGSATDYSFGWTYSFPEGAIAIVEQTDSPGKVRPRWDGRTLMLEVHADCISNKYFISDCIVRYAGYLAGNIIIPQAEEISRNAGVSPSRWEIGRGRRTLGTCHPSDRHITLSGLLLLLPHELRRFVICHELAHLTHADHSPAFHRLCDSYLSGREKELNRALKTFSWPVLR